MDWALDSLCILAEAPAQKPQHINREMILVDNLMHVFYESVLEV